MGVGGSIEEFADFVLYSGQLTVNQTIGNSRHATQAKIPRNSTVLIAMFDLFDFSLYSAARQQRMRFVIQLTLINIRLLAGTAQINRLMTS